MWAARHLPERQQRKFVGAGGTSSKRPRRDDALKERAKQREREIKAAEKDYAAQIPVRIGAAEAGDHETQTKSFSIWDWANRRVCQVCSRKPISRLCGKCGRLLCGYCILRENGRHRWVCPDCATPSDESVEQAQLLVEVLNEEVGDRTPIISSPPAEGPTELAASLAKRLVGSSAKADSFAWPAELKAKDWGVKGHRPHIPMKAVLEKFPEKREAWTGVSAPMKRPEPSRGSRVVKEELNSGDEEEKEKPTAAPATPGRVERGRSMGPVMRAEKRARGSTARALEVAESEALMAEARINLAQLVYAKSTAASKEAKGKLFVQIAEARNLQPFPITPVMEAKQLHIRMGHPWPENLEVCMQDADRALGRALGPARKAEEVWAEWLKKPKVIPKRSATQPSVGPEVWGLASAFLLREVELAHLMMEDVTFDFDKRTVTLGLSMSKTDPSGRGAKRTRACNCKARSGMKGLMDCPWLSGLTEEQVRKAPVVGQRGGPQLMVSKENMVATLKMDVAKMVEELEGHLESVPRPNLSQITGHTLRRSGAKDAVRRHQMPLAMVQWLGRWGSDAVRGYVEEALEEMPEMEVQLTTWQGLTEKALKLNGKQQKLEQMVEEVRKGAKGDCEELRGMIEGIKAAATPPMVANRATGMIHATAAKDSPQWKESPVLWTTRCGMWRWGVAGRLAKTLSAKEQTCDEMTVCLKCKPDLIAEWSSQAAERWKSKGCD